MYSPGLVETPPRTWGRRIMRNAKSKKQRNTPTHVGKTPLMYLVGTLDRKHPHARGEDLSVSPVPSEAEETPPRTWGRLTRWTTLSSLRRNTPTHVGKTLGRWREKNLFMKHPHARGEDTWNLLAFFLFTFNKELGRHLNQKLKIFPFGRNTGLQAKKSNSSVDESLSPQCTWH